MISPFYLLPHRKTMHPHPHHGLMVECASLSCLGLGLETCVSGHNVSRGLKCSCAVCFGLWCFCPCHEKTGLWTAATLQIGPKWDVELRWLTQGLLHNNVGHQESISPFPTAHHPNNMVYRQTPPSAQIATSMLGCTQYLDWKWTRSPDPLSQCAMTLSVCGRDSYHLTPPRDTAGCVPDLDPVGAMSRPSWEAQGSTGCWAEGRSIWLSIYPGVQGDGRRQHCVWVEALSPWCVLHWTMLHFPNTNILGPSHSIEA